MASFTESRTGSGAADARGEAVEELVRISRDTSLMALDALLDCLPRRGRNFADAALEARVVARRMRLATEDFAATADTLG